MPITLRCHDTAGYGLSLKVERGRLLGGFHFQSHALPRKEESPHLPDKLGGAGQGAAEATVPRDTGATDLPTGG